MPAYFIYLPDKKRGLLCVEAWRNCGVGVMVAGQLLALEQFPTRAGRGAQWIGLISSSWATFLTVNPFASRASTSCSRSVSPTSCSEVSGLK